MPIPFPGLSLLLCSYARLRRSPPPVGAVPADRPGLVAVIPALNEERTIPFAIASLARQTVRPDELVVVDDGSTDETAAVVAELAEGVEFDVTVIRHDEPQGKTPGIKEAARRADAETLFVLDADTYLESEDYLERLLAVHADAPAAGGSPPAVERRVEGAESTAEGRPATDDAADRPPSDDALAADGGEATARRPVGCAFGRVRPLTRRDRADVLDRDVSALVGEESRTRALLEADLADRFSLSGTLRYLAGRWPVEQYRRSLYSVEQNFVKDGYMRLFGSALFPAGCGVLYDRAELVAVFDEYEESLGDDLTNSEDTFLGFALADRGLANVQVTDVSMRTTEPTLRRLPRQLYLWSSAYLQSAYYFRGLSTRLRAVDADETPDAPESALADDREATDGDEPEADRTADATVEATDGGTHRSRRRVPPFGRAVVAQLVDGLYPTTLLVILLLVLTHAVEAKWLAVLLGFEFGVYALVATATARRRLRALGSTLVAVPLRLAQLPMGTYVYLRVGSDLLRGRRDWRK